MLSIQRGGKSAKEAQGKSMKSAKQVTTQFIPPTHPAIIITSAFNAPHIQKLKDALQEHYIAFGMQTSKKKVNRPPGSPTDKNFIVVDDSAGPSLLEGQFLGLKMCRVDYPRANNTKDVIKKFDKYIGLGKMNEKVDQQHQQENYAHRQSDQFNQKQLLKLRQQGKPKSNIAIAQKYQLGELQNAIEAKNMLSKLKNGKQGNDGQNIRLKSIGKYGQKNVNISLTKRILFILMTQRQSERYSQYLRRLGNIKNKRIIPIKSLSQYYRLAYAQGEGENCLLLGPNIASKQLYKFRNLKNVYIYGEDPKFCAQLVKGNIKRVGMTPNQMDEILIQEGFDKNEEKEYDPPKNFGKDPELVGKGIRRSYSQKKPEKDSLFKRFVRFIKGKKKDKEPQNKDKPKDKSKSSTSSSNSKKNKTKKTNSKEKEKDKDKGKNKSKSSSSSSSSSTSRSSSSRSRNAKSSEKANEIKKNKTLRRLKNNENPDQAMMKQPSGKALSDKQLVSLGEFVEKSDNDTYRTKSPENRSAKSRKFVKLKTYQGNPINVGNPSDEPQKTRSLVPSTNDINFLKANKPPQGELQIDSYIGQRNSKPQIAFGHPYKLGKQNDNDKNKKAQEEKKIQFLIGNPIFKKSPPNEQPDAEFILSKKSGDPKYTNPKQEPEDQDFNNFSKKPYDPTKVQNKNAFIEGTIKEKQKQQYQLNFTPFNPTKEDNKTDNFKPNFKIPPRPEDNSNPDSDDDEYYNSQPKQPKPTTQQFAHKVGNLNVNQDHNYFHQIKYIPEKENSGPNKKIYKNISDRPDFYVQNQMNKQSLRWPLKQSHNGKSENPVKDTPKVLRNTIKNVRPAECNNSENSDKQLGASYQKVPEFASPNKIQVNVSIPLKNPNDKGNDGNGYPNSNHLNNTGMSSQPINPPITANHIGTPNPYSTFPIGSPMITQCTPPNPLFTHAGFPSVSPTKKAQPYYPGIAIPMAVPHNFIPHPLAKSSPNSNLVPNTGFKLPFDENLYDKFIENGIVVYRPKKSNIPPTFGSSLANPPKFTRDRSISPSYNEVGNGQPFNTTASSYPHNAPLPAQFAKPFFSNKPTKESISASSQNEPTVGRNPSFSTYQYFINKGEIQPKLSNWPQKLKPKNKRPKRTQNAYPHEISQSSDPEFLTSSTPKRRSYEKYNYPKKYPKQYPKHKQNKYPSKSKRNRNSYEQDQHPHHEYFSGYPKLAKMTKTGQAFYDSLDSGINNEISNPKRHSSSKSRSKGKLRDPLSSILDANSPRQMRNPHKNYSVLYLVNSALPAHVIKQLFQICQSTDTIQTFSQPAKMHEIIQKGKTVFDFVIVFDEDKKSSNFQPDNQAKGLYSVSYQPDAPESIVNNKIIVLRKTWDLLQILNQAWMRISLTKVNYKTTEKKGQIGYIYYKDFNRPIRDMAKILKNYFPNSEIRKYFSLQDLPTKLPNINNSITIILLDEVSFTQISQYCNSQQKQNLNLLKICIPKTLQSMKICKNQPGTQKMVWLTENQLKDQDFLLKRIQKRIFS